MIGAATSDALDEIAARAADLRDAYRGGARPQHDDVWGAPALFPSTDPLSVAAPAGTWFVTAGKDGRAFTRDGGFRFDEGVLRTADGSDVLGYPAGDARGAVPEPLRLPVADRALGRCADVAISSDGSVAYTRAAIDPRTGARSVERVSIGTLALARFPAGSVPNRLDAARVAAPPGVAPHLGTPADGTFPGVATATREAGAIDVDAALRRLNEAYLSFEALGAARRARAGVDKTSLDLVK